MSKENIAGLEIDISKVIGDELAKIASSMVSEEKLNKLVEYELDKLVDKPVNGFGFTNKESEITKQTTYAFMKVIASRIDEIVNSEDHKVFIEQRAKDIYKMAVETGTKYMVEGIAKRMSVSAFDIEGSHKNIEITNIAYDIINDHERKHHGGY